MASLEYTVNRKNQENKAYRGCRSIASFPQKTCLQACQSAPPVVEMREGCHSQGVTPFPHQNHSNKNVGCQGKVAIKSCSIVNCKKSYYAKGFCRNHYAQRIYRKSLNKYGYRRKCQHDGCQAITLISDLCRYHRHSKKGPASGRRNGNWKGGISEYANHYQLKKTRIEKLKAASYKCEICYAPATLVHHLDKSKNNHSLFNLIALCRKCHVRTYHRDSVGRPRKNPPLNNTESSHETTIPRKFLPININPVSQGQTA